MTTINLDDLKDHVRDIYEIYSQLLNDRLSIREAKTSIELRLNLLKKYEYNSGDYDSRIFQVCPKQKRFITLSLDYNCSDKSIYQLYMTLVPNTNNNEPKMLIPGYAD